VASAGLPEVYAQSLIEYGALTSTLSSNVRQLTYDIQDWISQITPLTWLAVGAVVVVGLFLRRRR
jgi:hypothetical protein